MEKPLVNWQPEDLENDIIKLQPMAVGDFEKLYEVASDPEIWEQHPVRERYKEEIFRLFFNGAIEWNTAFLIINKNTGSVIGSTRYYDYQPDNSRIAIGYTFLAKAFWGDVHNRLSKKLMLDYAFQYVNEIYFHIGANNIRSQMAVKKIGAQQVREVDFDHYGEKLLHYEYVIKKHDWEKFNVEQS
jgi:RimJ/RimL family protein N-acetyltransferase